MSLYSLSYPSRTYNSRRASSRRPFLSSSARGSCEISTETLTEHFSCHRSWDIPEQTSEETLLTQQPWLRPLDNIMSDNTSEQWKNPFPTIPTSEHPGSGEPFSSICYPVSMPINFPSASLPLDRDPRFEVTWAKDGSDMPKNWPVWYRRVILACVSFATLVV